MKSPLFTRRHYEWLATFCAQTPSMQEGWQVQDLMRALKKDNERFDTARFMKAVSERTPSP